MGIMPHTDIDRALEVALSLDIPFWPQLPKVSYFEDMYVQALEHFPGTRIDIEHQRSFSTSPISMRNFQPISRRRTTHRPSS